VAAQEIAVKASGVLFAGLLASFDVARRSPLEGNQGDEIW